MKLIDNTTHIITGDWEYTKDYLNNLDEAYCLDIINTSSLRLIIIL